MTSEGGDSYLTTVKATRGATATKATTRAATATRVARTTRATKATTWGLRPPGQPGHRPRRLQRPGRLPEPVTADRPRAGCSERGTSRPGCPGPLRSGFGFRR